jgi:hypothetical protein
VRFHPRLTVLGHAGRAAARWVASLLGPGARADTLVEVDGVVARVCDVPRALHALPPLEPTDSEAFFRFAAVPAPSAAAVERVAADFARWEQVLARAAGRLAGVRAAAPRVGPVDVARASVLRNEWRYAEAVHASDGRRRTRRAADRHRERLEQFLAPFGARTVEDLTVVATGFGDTGTDAAIREAATVVSMARQRGAELRAELDRHAALSGTAAGPAAALDASAAERALARLLATRDDTAYVRPLAFDRTFDGAGAAVRRRAFERLAAYARRRQVLLLTESADLPGWAAAGPADTAACRWLRREPGLAPTRA